MARLETGRIFRENGSQKCGRKPPLSVEVGHVGCFGYSDLLNLALLLLKTKSLWSIRPRAFGTVVATYFADKFS